MSDKAQNFKRLAIKRTKNALKQIELIGNLSSPNYEYTEKQAGKITEVLFGAVDELKAKLYGRLDAAENFDLEDESDEGGTDPEEDIADEPKEEKVAVKEKPKKKTKKKEPEPEEEEEFEDEEEIDVDEDEEDDEDLDIEEIS